MPVDPDWVVNAQLWLVLDRQAAQPYALEDVTERCIIGGVDAVLCRLKDEPALEARRSLASPVRAVCAKQGVPFIMSHDVTLARDLAADGLQLGITDPPLHTVRELLPESIRIGYSVHAIAEAASRLGEGADYVFLGPIFPTPAKLKYGNPLSLSTVIAAIAQLPCARLVFIGGINHQNIAQLLQAGARRIAAISALQAVPDPTAAAAVFKRQLATYP